VAVAAHQRRRTANKRGFAGNRNPSAATRGQVDSRAAWGPASSGFFLGPRHSQRMFGGAMIKYLPLGGSADGAGCLGRFIFRLVPAAWCSRRFRQAVLSLASRVQRSRCARTWQVFVDALSSADGVGSASAGASLSTGESRSGCQLAPSVGSGHARKLGFCCV